MTPQEVKEGALNSLYSLIETELRLVHVCLEDPIEPWHLERARAELLQIKAHMAKLVEVACL